jgi:hypothetical protein
LERSVEVDTRVRPIGENGFCREKLSKLSMCHNGDQGERAQINALSGVLVRTGLEAGAEANPTAGSSGGRS